MTTISSKHAKYTTPNLISRGLVQNFFMQLKDLYLRINPEKVFDGGCGEGFVLNTLHSIRPIKEAFAIDIDEKEVVDAIKNIPFCNTQQGSLYSIPFEANQFDLVICSEVLEHLGTPEKALVELHRVCSEFAILSVPREPVWRLMNMARLKYWSAFGNTPDHRNHWNTKSFIRFIEPYFELIEVRKPLPWTIVLVRKKLS